MSFENFECIYHLLSQYHFQFIGNVDERLKCLICGKLLIDPCHVECGCRFCRICINDMFSNGIRFCPGNSETCYEESLSNATTDYMANRQIAKLVVQCPNEGCLQENQLVNMKEHLRLCTKRSVKCPFYNLGCSEEKLLSENMNEHLQTVNYTHMKVLIEIINNIKNELIGLQERESENENEITILKKNNIGRDDEIEMLKQQIKEKDEKIDRMNEKIGLLTTNQEFMSFQNQGSEIKFKDDKIARAIESIDKHIKLLKVENSEHIKSEIDKLNTKINDQIIDLKQKIRDIDEKLSNVNDKIQNYQIDTSQRLFITEKWKDKQTSGIFMWFIDGIEDRRKKNEIIRSEYFYTRMKPIKMALRMYANGEWDVAGTDLSILLDVYGDSRNKLLKWPVHVNVTVKITNKSNVNTCKILSRNCYIDRPVNPFLSTFIERFDFMYADLFNNLLLVGNCLIVECNVDLL